MYSMSLSSSLLRMRCTEHNCTGTRVNIGVKVFVIDITYQVYDIRSISYGIRYTVYGVGEYKQKL